MSRPKLFSEIKGQIHDASGIDNPYHHYWEQVYGIWYPMVGSKKPEVYARKCDITGKGFNEGYCFGNGEEYAIDEASAIKIAMNRGYETLEDAFDDGDYYYSDWIPDPDNEECYDEGGNVVSVPEGDVVKPMRPPLSNGEVRDLLDSIMEKIANNSFSAWNDRMDNTHQVVAMEDFPKGVEKQRCIQYNGWYDDLINLKNKLK